MTARFAMAGMLLLILAGQGWGLFAAWRDDPMTSLASGKKKETVSAPKPMPAGGVRLQPTPPETLPDFNQGYLFNGERSLAAGGGKGGKAQAASVTIDKIHYSGAIITDANPRALLSYALGDSSGGAAGNQPQGFLRVTLGDTVNGYKVTEILADKIIFSRDGQTITKLLYDKTKDRGQGPAPLASREQSGQQPKASPESPAPMVKVTEPQRTPAPSKQLKPPPTLPSDEELRKKPLRRRPQAPPT